MAHVHLVADAMPQRDYAERRRLYENGLNDCEIAEAVGLTPGAIKQWRDKNDLSPNYPRGNPRPIEERFFEKVTKTDTCWCWEGAIKSDGYGSIHDDGTMRPAHRVSYEIHNGDIPEGGYILHTCDEPTCVNPDHLYEGDQSDNMQDRVERNPDSFLTGHKHPNSKLSVADAREICRRYAEGDTTQRELAEAYEVSQCHISKIVNGESWHDV